MNRTEEIEDISSQNPMFHERHLGVGMLPLYHGAVFSAVV